jgi:hypothetical protein
MKTSGKKNEKAVEQKQMLPEEYAIAEQLHAVCGATDIEDLNYVLPVLSKLTQRLHMVRGRYIDQKEAREQGRFCFFVCQIFKLPAGEKEEALTFLKKAVDRSKLKKRMRLIKGGKSSLKGDCKL